MRYTDLLGYFIAPRSSRRVSTEETDCLPCSDLRLPSLSEVRCMEPHATRNRTFLGFRARATAGEGGEEPPAPAPATSTRAQSPVEAALKKMDSSALPENYCLLETRESVKGGIPCVLLASARRVNLDAPAKYCFLNA